MLAKIKSIEELAVVARGLQSEGKRIVHCHGVFDLLHIGHLRYLREARSMGDVLLVTLTPDRFVDKGPHRPAFGEVYRAESLASLDMVDFVAVNEWPTAEETLLLLRPDVYVKGSEFRDLASDPTGKISREAEVVRHIGAQLAFTDNVVFSSSNLINRYLSNLPAKLDAYLRLFRTRHSLDEVLDYVEAMSALKVLVVGDTILDRYEYCQVLGKSSKDPILAVKHSSTDLFVGGVLAVGNHLSSFVGGVNLLTILGEHDRHEEFITEHLDPAVRPHFMTKPGAPTLVKHRLIDGYALQKLIEIYVMDDSPLPPDLDRDFCRKFRDLAADCDLVVVTDYGHATISANMVKTMIEASPYLAVNTQANAGNRGFHTISSYDRADFVSLAEHEIRLDARDMRSDIRGMIQRQSRRMDARHFIVTTGREGSVVYREGEGYIEVPSFATRVVDRVGAGDAFFSLAALAARLDMPSEIVGFLGNIAGTLAVEFLGNKKFIDKTTVKKYITALLK
jgi:rfaE bifunctional protein nucleotidyltransferase chain/domain